MLINPTRLYLIRPLRFYLFGILFLDTHKQVLLLQFLYDLIFSLLWPLCGRRHRRSFCCCCCCRSWFLCQTNKLIHFTGDRETVCSLVSFGAIRAIVVVAIRSRLKTIPTLISILFSSFVVVAGEAICPFQLCVCASLFGNRNLNLSFDVANIYELLHTETHLFCLLNFKIHFLFLSSPSSSSSPSLRPLCFMLFSFVLCYSCIS